MTFRHVEKNDLISEIELISNFMASQPGSQAIAIGIYHNIT